MGLFSTKRKEEWKKGKVIKTDAKTGVKTVAKTVAKTTAKATDRTSEKTAEKTPENKAFAAVSASVVLNENNRVILRPRITEKATLKADAENVFTFEIDQNATKLNVRKAIVSIYGITPTKVSIVRNPSKKVFSRGKRGVVSGVKKAYVYLKEGDKIEIV